MSLRWESQGRDVWYGCSGDIVAAMVIKPEVDNSEGRWTWRLCVGPTKYICKVGDDDVPTYRHAIRNAEHAFKKWLKAMGLEPVKSGEGDAA